VSQSQAYRNKDAGKFSIFLGLENGSPIGNSLERVGEFYDKGVRYMTLCHSKDNQICDSCASEVKTWHGLSPFGREVVAEMNRLGMLIDVSHVSDETFYDVLECSAKPVVATHSCCRALCDHPRNMTDDMIRSLAAKGGVIQINFYPVFLEEGFKEEQMFEAVRPSYTRIVDHIDHVVRLVGIDHVGIGSDFDGIDVTPDGLEDISMMPKVFDEMRRRGYSEADIENVASRNFFNVLSY
jgi:membrane dipeptidase